MAALQNDCVHRPGLQAGWSASPSRDDGFAERPCEMIAWDPPHEDVFVLKVSSSVLKEACMVVAHTMKGRRRYHASRLVCATGTAISRPQR